MRGLLRALEEKKRVIELLDRFLEQPPGELEVHVGLEAIHPAMKDLALIGMSVRMASGLPAKVAVLGPMRMHRSEEHTSELQSLRHLVCRLLLEKKYRTPNGCRTAAACSVRSPSLAPASHM